MKKLDKKKNSWTFFSNHAHVLICLTQDSTMLLKDVAKMVGITERAVQRIVADLESANYLVREKEGRQNVYHVNTKLPLRHQIEAHKSVGMLLKLVAKAKKLNR